MMTRAESVSNRTRLRLCEKFRKWKSIFHYQFLHSKSWSNTSSLRICYDQPTDKKMLWIFIFQKDVRCAATLPFSGGDLSCSSSTDSTTNTTTTSSSTLSLGGTAAQCSMTSTWTNMQRWWSIKRSTCQSLPNSTKNNCSGSGSARWDIESGSWTLPKRQWRLIGWWTQLNAPILNYLEGKIAFRSRLYHMNIC